MSKNKTTEMRLLRPRQVPLDPERAREAVVLLGELLLDAAATRRRRSSSGARDRNSDDAIDSAVRFSRTRRDGREAA
jgi:hypothetical protein